MKAIITVSALALAMAAPPGARAEVSERDVAELRQQVEALLQRVRQLESRDAGLVPGAAPGARLDELEARVADVETAGDGPSDALARGADRDRKSEWAERLKWKGDFRYRHEQFDIEGVAADRVRHRIRARLGVDAVLGDTLRAGFQLATGDRDDPRSSNATLDDASRRKDIALDLAYVDWRAFDGAVVTLGKQKKPWFEPGNSLFHDGDVNPEGVAFRWQGGAGAFASAWGYWLEESASQADSNLLGAQFGWHFERAGLTLAAGYWDYGAVQRQPILKFADAPAGNSTFTGNPDCSGTGTVACYTHDYDIIGLDAQWSGRVGALPLTLFAGWLRNTDPGDLDTGYNAGFQLGQAAEPGSWQLGALYQQVERDAQFAAFLDSDFGGGVTQTRGLQLQGAWAPAQNLSLKATLYLNDVGYDTASEFDYRRLQLDMNYRF